MTKRRQPAHVQWWLGLALCSALLGCQTSSPTPVVINHEASVPLPVDRPATANEAVASAPSAVRLTNMQGAMLMYYAINKRLPVMLQELQALPDVGADVQLTSPESGKPYMYSSDGLLLAGSGKRIIVWDPVPGRNGKRWCILMPRTDNGGPVSLELVEIPEAGFQAYVPPIN